MKKKILLIGSLSLVLLFVLAVLFMAKSSLGISKGAYLLSDHGASLIVIDNSPVSMHSQRDKDDLFEDLSDGDKVLILHDGIAESYPGKTGAYHTNRNDHILRRPCPSLCLLFLRLFGRMDR